MKEYLLNQIGKKYLIFLLLISILCFYSCGQAMGTGDNAADGSSEVSEIPHTFGDAFKDSTNDTSDLDAYKTDMMDSKDTGQETCSGPIGWDCKDKNTLYHCNNGFIETKPCGEKEACISGSCLPVICSPGATECTSPSTYRQCNDTGTEWSADKPCESGSPQIKAYCDPETNKCVCELPVHVLFVVDASGSMELVEVEPGKTQWDVALEAISEIMDKYPFLTYGLSTFPSQTVNCGPSNCIGGGGCAYSDSVNIDLATGQIDAIKKYLQERKLTTDTANLKYVLTPLLGILNYLADGYPDTGPLKNHPYPAYVVILSDGQDSCFNPLSPEAAIGPLAEPVKKLLDKYNVKTFAIGFNLVDGFSQLDGIAMHGGTGLSKHVSASDMKSLIAAFQMIFDSMEIRNCDKWSDQAKPPDCLDADGDVWCESLDCNDTNAKVNYGAGEIAGNSVDEDCGGLTDEPVDENLDQDKDGFTPAQGDCNDFDPLVNPSTFEDPDDGIDNNCDGKKDEKGCECNPATGTTLQAMACASEISCMSASFKSQNISSPTGDDLSQAWTAVSHFGSAGNDLAPKAGKSYALFASGPATGTSHSTDMSSGSSSTDTFSESSPIYDVVEWKVNFQAPMNAKGFSIDYVFFSEEYDDYVGTQFNDKFYILMDAPKTTKGQLKVINFTDCRNPSDYYDLSGSECPLQSGYCCYIAINTALSECCWYEGCPKGKWKTDISGTGFTCASSEFMDSSSYGSSTGWLTTSWTIEPGESFSLTFHIHDTGDGIFDSEVILDNFRWHSTPTTPGTEPAN